MVLEIVAVSASMALLSAALALCARRPKSEPSASKAQTDPRQPTAVTAHSTYAEWQVGQPAPAGAQSSYAQWQVEQADSDSDDESVAVKDYEKFVQNSSMFDSLRTVNSSEIDYEDVIADCFPDLEAGVQGDYDNTTKMERVLYSEPDPAPAATPVASVRRKEDGKEEDDSGDDFEDIDQVVGSGSARPRAATASFGTPSEQLEYRSRATTDAVRSPSSPLAKSQTAAIPKFIPGTAAAQARPKRTAQTARTPRLPMTAIEALVQAALVHETINRAVANSILFHAIPGAFLLRRKEDPKGYWETALVMSIRTKEPESHLHLMLTREHGSSDFHLGDCLLPGCASVLDVLRAVRPGGLHSKAMTSPITPAGAVNAMRNLPRLPHNVHNVALHAGIGEPRKQ
ncbi:uncharacterized protein MONBRDRAFT_39103 [Monosiga brevicollis MX1]|uniref:SH2 domain-containing protein n=1 Tax=Monosiga brevicollis TaxID=81824 RepID=A9VC78_MONBE|nr:uncharacterized protein MONBRDRAFT_39103 [Monosiga brevicollis MX1]EDQ84851.1 predicted protein [Monosiga brevicollis MX1]|eukprot:XP_001750352.1 hypothetical protein [Monosiga brevicollis MX1]